MANNNKDNNNRNHKNLYYLNELSDYKIASDDPDVRSWKVKDADNRVIGEVDNLLVNKRTERVVYLDVEVESSIIEADHDPYGQPADSDVHEFINKEGENHIIIPVGLVNLNHDEKFVYTDRINHRTFAETKRMEKGSTVNREYEVVVLDSYDRDHRNDRDRVSGSTSNNNDGRDRDSNFDRDVNKRDNDYVGDSGRRNQDSSVDSSRRDSDFDRDSNNRDSNRRDSNLDIDRERRDVERDRETSRDLQSRDRDRNSDSGDRGRDHDDDSFYDRREFDRTNYRRRT
jgi:hypothetical protein